MASRPGAHNVKVKPRQLNAEDTSLFASTLRGSLPEILAFARQVARQSFNILTSILEAHRSQSDLDYYVYIIKLASVSVT